MKAVIAYQKKLDILTCVEKPLKLNKEMENKRKKIVRSFSLAKDIYTTGQEISSLKESELEAGAEFLEVYIIKCFIVFCPISLGITFILLMSFYLKSIRGTTPHHHLLLS